MELLCTLQEDLLSMGKELLEPYLLLLVLITTAFGFLKSIVRSIREDAADWLKEHPKLQKLIVLVLTLLSGIGFKLWTGAFDDVGWSLHIGLVLVSAAGSGAVHDNVTSPSIGEAVKWALKILKGAGKRPIKS